MKRTGKLLKLFLFFGIYQSAQLTAQCTFASQYASAVINNTNPGNIVTITTCQWGGEYAPLTFNVTGAFTFSSSVATDYFTLTNVSNVVVASGFSPLNFVVSTTGLYYLHTAASGPPLCLTQNVCRTTQVIVPIPPCTGVPLSGTTSASQSLICPNTSATITLPGASTGTGLQFQWFASTTNSLSGYTSIAGATAIAYATPPSASVTTWYQAVLTCTNSAASATSPAVSVAIAATTTNSIPYAEGFEGAIVPNQLPNCSWKASDLPQTCQTYIAPASNNRIPRTGNNFASFYYLPARTSYFYTNGLQLHAGVTYSASVWFTTESNTYQNWTNMSLAIGTNQSTLGLVPVASTNGSAVSPNHKSLSSTFTVATSGIYYMAVQATSNGQCCAQYLSFDDLSVTVPCSMNIPVASLNTSTASICQGQALNLVVLGGDTYQWSTGATSSSIVVSPQTTSFYSVAITNTSSGCSITLGTPVTVYPTNQVSIYSSSTQICSGSSAVLQAFGASTYSWSNGTTGISATVTPFTTSTYSLIGANNFSCTSLSNITITVNPLPTVAASSSKTLSCAGDPVQLTALAQGAVSYKWLVDNNLYFANPVLVSPVLTSICSVTVTNTKGCEKSTSFVQNVTACVSLTDRDKTGSKGVRIYPNPTSGQFKLETSGDSFTLVNVTDVFGKLVFSLALDTTSPLHGINLSHVSNGLYFIHVSGPEESETIKLLKTN